VDSDDAITSTGAAGWLLVLGCPAAIRIPNHQDWHPLAPRLCRWPQRARRRTAPGLSSSECWTMASGLAMSSPRFPRLPRPILLVLIECVRQDNLAIIRQHLSKRILSVLPRLIITGWNNHDEMVENPHSNLQVSR